MLHVSNVAMHEKYVKDTQDERIKLVDQNDDDDAFNVKLICQR